jgi:2-polyprenyl-6-methoxyphenol hydroxylase-like FAD-dependent oxidoreductase
MFETISNGVVISGAGPVGLTAALALARTGMPVTLLEKRSSLNTASKACTFHPATLDILGSLGAVGPMLRDGQRADRIDYRSAEEGLVARFDLGLLANDTDHPFRIHIEQARLSWRLLEMLRAFDQVVIRFDSEVVDVAQDADGVAVHYRRGGRREVVHAQYAIVAEGSRSNLRQDLGISFNEIPYEHRILRLMTEDDLGAWLPGLAPLAYYFNGDKSTSFLKLPDCWRIILRVPAEVDDVTSLDPNWYEAVLAENVPEFDRVPRITDKDTYRTSRAVASDFAVGRVLVAGDAAHVTNTRGGMNLNCGIHDAYTYAQALIRAVNDGDHAAVGAAANERKDIAANQLLERTHSNVAEGRARLDRVRALAADPAGAREHLLKASMLDIAPRPARGEEVLS